MLKRRSSPWADVEGMHRTRRGSRRTAVSARRGQPGLDRRRCRAARSRKYVSIFNLGLDSSVLGEFTRSVEADHQVFPLLVGRDGLRVFVDCICEVGYVDSEPTSIVAVEWASSAVHCYPVAFSEVRRAGAESNLIYDDSLQGEARAMRGASPG